LDALLDDYYNVMGWNSEGIPTKEKLNELKLNKYV
jgi:aldehyde:ferredoxin oxidoreductase